MNKVAFVTGAGGYIGNEIARIFARNGIAVAVCDISETALETTLKQIKEEGGIAKPYVASKGGIMSLTKALSKEMGPDGINVMCVAPGCVPRPTAVLDDHYKYGTNYINKMCLAKDVADLVEFLCSDKNNFITGQTYRTLALKGTDGD